MFLNTPTIDLPFVVLILQAIKRAIASRGHSNDDFENTFVAILDSLATLFTKMTLDNCSVCVKTLSQDHNRVRSFRRDSHSLIERGPVDFNLTIYNAKENSAFSKIIDNQFLLGYSCNDLINTPDYHNKNTSWNCFYNATCIAPIRPPLAVFGESVFGFLCVDNQQGGFSEETLVLLQLFANELYFLFHEMKA